MEYDESNLLLLSSQECFHTYAVFNKILRRYQPFLREIDLTYTQYIVMMVMWEREKVSEKEIGEALFLKPNTLTDTLRIMKRKGLVVISKDEADKRKLQIEITDKGLGLKKKALSSPQSAASGNSLPSKSILVLAI